MLRFLPEPGLPPPRLPSLLLDLDIPGRILRTTIIATTTRDSPQAIATNTPKTGVIVTPSL